MNIFSKFFGDKEKQQSYVRNWAYKKQEELKYSNDITPENLFAGMMYGLVTFAKDDPRRKKIPEFEKVGLDICRHFGGDASLFEVGCYLYFRIDMWLFLNKPNLRKLISTTFIREFNNLFSYALKLKNIPDILAERVDKYGELARNKEDIQQYYFFLSQLIARTKDNTEPKHYNFGKEPLNLQFFEDTFIKMELISWEKAMMPALIKSLEKYCTLMEKTVEKRNIENEYCKQGTKSNLNDDGLDEVREFIKINKYDEAINELNKIIEYNKDNLEAYLMKAGILQLMDKQDEAIKLYEDIIVKYPDKTEAYKELIDIYALPSQKTDEVNKKIISLCKKLESINENKTPYNVLAKVYDDLEKPDMALLYYDKAIKQEIIHIQAEAHILNDKSQPQDILDYALDDICERRYNLYRLLSDKAFCLKMMAQFDEEVDSEKNIKLHEAIRLYEDAIKLNISRDSESDSYSEYESISEIYNLLGDYEKAKLCREKAEQLEKLARDEYDRSQGRMTDDEFEEWYSSYFDFDNEGNIIGIKKSEK